MPALAAASDLAVDRVCTMACNRTGEMPTGSEEVAIQTPSLHQVLHNVQLYIQAQVSGKVDSTGNIKASSAELKLTNSISEVQNAQ